MKIEVSKVFITPIGLLDKRSVLERIRTFLTYLFYVEPCPHCGDKDVDCEHCYYEDVLF